jgi:GNAT superfamily N-acetyltransferase
MSFCPGGLPVVEERHHPLPTSQLVSLRRAAPEDAQIVAAIHRQAAFLPPLHSASEDLQFVRERLMAENQVWVAEADGEVVGYIAFNDVWLSHLMVDPDHQGRGHGATLLARAIADRRERQLWTYQKNTRARRFYEARGWELVELTDGQGNEHGEPEVRYAWRP